MRIDEFIYVSFTVYSDLGCISKNRSSAYLKFTDGSVIELFHMGETECGENESFTSVMIDGDITDDEHRGWTDDEFDDELARVQNILYTKKLEKVKFQGTEYYTILEVDEIRQNAFTHLLNLVK